MNGLQNASRCECGRCSPKVATARRHDPLRSSAPAARTPRTSGATTTPTSAIAHCGGGVAHSEFVSALHPRRGLQLGTRPVPAPVRTRIMLRVQAVGRGQVRIQREGPLERFRGPPHIGGRGPCRMWPESGSTVPAFPRPARSRRPRPGSASTGRAPARGPALWSITGLAFG